MENIRFVNFDRLTHFTGRRYVKCSGIELMKTPDENLMLIPLNSRKKEGQCDISMPTENLPDLIKELFHFVKDKGKLLESLAGN